MYTQSRPVTLTAFATDETGVHKDETGVRQGNASRAVLLDQFGRPGQPG